MHKNVAWQKDYQVASGDCQIL